MSQEIQCDRLDQESLRRARAKPPARAAQE
jgi:hypothetical protein